MGSTQKNPVSLLVLAVGLFVLGARAVPAQDYRFTIDAPSSVSLGAGPVTFQGICRLEVPAGRVSGGWTISMTTSGPCSIVSATTAETVAAAVTDTPPGFRDDSRLGFERTELTTGPGNEGAVSVVVLGPRGRITLPPGNHLVLSPVLEVSATGTCRVLYQDGLQGAGTPIINAVDTGAGALGPLDSSDTAETSITITGVRFARGDADADGSINLTDAIVVLGFLFLGTRMPECMDAADADDDAGDNLALTDAIVILSWLFQGGPAPPEPTPSSGTYVAEDCGPDPTPDGLGCDTPPQVCR